MKVFITGCAGYIGSVLTGDLLSAGHEVVGIDTLLHGPTGLASNLGRDGFKFHRLDVRDRSAMQEKLNGCDAAVHLAAIVGDPACTRQPEVATSVNLDASHQLFELCCDAQIRRFVFASTCSNYGRMLDPTSYVTEESELRPVSHYAETKVGFEKRLLDETDRKAPIVTVLRLATVFGLSPRMRFDLTVNEFTLELHRRKQLTIFGEQFWRPYVHVRDVARAMRDVLQADTEKVRGQVFNVGDTNENYQKGSLVEMIREHIGDNVAIERVHKNEDPRDYRVSFEKIRRELSFKITRGVNDGITEVLDALNEGLFTDDQNACYRN
ncbi:MAG: NAD-dependent epimerase/dehydratase family protein [Pyrinomonadaceae bacterium]